MDLTPRLVGTLAVPGSPSDGGPAVLQWPHRRIVTVRRDAALVAYDLDRLLAGDTTPVASFPAPWPDRSGGVDAVSPQFDVAVFVGQHGLQAVGPDGAVRWQLPHTCWTGGCMGLHGSYDEYAGDPEHRYPGSGSAWISADGRTVWAHVRGPLAGDAVPDRPAGHRDDAADELWLVLDAADGRVLARAATGTAAAGSNHIPHPDPTRMGLSVGEGRDGSPMRWARWDGSELTVTHLGDDRALVACGPSGRTFISLDHALQDLAVHRLPDGAVTGTLFAKSLPGADDESRWDYVCGPVDDRTIVAGTSRHGHGDADVRHWLVDADDLTARGPLRYPATVGSDPRGLGDGTWITSGEDRFRLDVWRLDG
ncbi:hypothetical protein GCM10010399_83750 [Dactylosporangium fulvum]|uniref:Uncharacterized protein n=1 Tax=Dactylosporangium fulvum TaxID=53359 RepID=A0ABY5VMY1_9ACTN|nr:hypothetical protein [Dactylosporangium fulvum]UWP79083.1 hypothetical protein Dfulv_28385 [Dactylosporangium fulvum]